MTSIFTNKPNFKPINSFILLSLFLWIPNIVFSQNTLTLHIKDADMNPIEDAVVFIDDDHASETVSNASGIVEYQLFDGSYIIYSYAPDYLDQFSHVILEGEDKTIDIIHKPSVFWSTAPTNPRIGSEFL